MESRTHRLLASILVLPLLFSVVCTDVEDGHADDPELFHFVTVSLDRYFRHRG